MAHSAFQVGSNGEIKNASMREGLSDARFHQRQEMLGAIETDFIKSNRGQLPKDHAEVYEKATHLMTSSQMQAFKVNEEKPETVEWICAFQKVVL